MTDQISPLLPASPPAVGNHLSPGRKAAWRYILVDQGLVAIFVNFAINWGIARAVFRNLPHVPMQGDLSLQGDTIATCWMLPLISCLIVTSLTRQEIRKGRIPRLTSRSASPHWLPKLTQNVFVRAAGWGLIGRFLLAPVAAAGLLLTGIHELPLQQFLILKALFACALGIFFCPFHAWWALHDAPKSPALPANQQGIA